MGKKGCAGAYIRLFFRLWMVRCTGITCGDVFLLTVQRTGGSIPILP